MTKETNQTKHDCMIKDCIKKGRSIGHLGGLPLNYCAEHRHYGVRVLDFFIDSLLRYKLTDFLEETRRELFMKNLPKISDNSYKVLSDYVKNMANQLEQLEELNKLKKMNSGDEFENE